MAQLASTSSGQKAAVARALAYQHPSLVGRIERKLHLTQKEAEFLFEDMKRFLALAAVTDLPIAPSPAIDNAWHEFLMYTEDYQQFCRDTVGAYIHHRPNDLSGPLPRQTRERIASDTRGLAEATFGPLSLNWEYDLDSEDDCGPDINCESAPGDCALNIAKPTVAVA